MPDCLLLLGSNLGDRRRALARATAGLARLPGARPLKLSRLYETAPVGPSRKRYLNQAALLRTKLSPMGLLVECKRLEALAGRKPAARWTARALDVDIVAYGRTRLETPWLTLPHPAMAGRAFALAPLADVAPGWRLGGRAIASRLARLNPAERTVKIY